MRWAKFVLGGRLSRDVIAHDAGEKIAAFNLDKAESVEKFAQLTRRVEMLYGIREIANTLHALGGTAEQFCREPDRASYKSQIRHFDQSRFRPQHIIVAEDAARFEHAADFVKRADNLEMARRELQRHAVERIIGKRQRMSIADAGMDRE